MGTVKAGLLLGINNRLDGTWHLLKLLRRGVEREAEGERDAPLVHQLVIAQA